MMIPTYTRHKAVQTPVQPGVQSVHAWYCPAEGLSVLDHKLKCRTQRRLNSFMSRLPQHRRFGVVAAGASGSAPEGGALNLDVGGSYRRSGKDSVIAAAGMRWGAD
jgi:hypothetical protein